MSDLTRQRDHCRIMADRRPLLPLTPYCKPWGMAWEPHHERCDDYGCGCDCHPWNKPIPEPERRLWAAMADEIDTYLAGADDEQEGLFSAHAHDSPRKTRNILTRRGKCPST